MREDPPSSKVAGRWSVDAEGLAKELDKITMDPPDGTEEEESEAPGTADEDAIEESVGGGAGIRQSKTKRTTSPSTGEESEVVGCSQTLSPDTSLDSADRTSPERKPRNQHQEQREQRDRPPGRYSVSELVKTLGHEKDTSQMPPELERRVLDFRLARLKRREKYGKQNRCGIFGMYAHLSDVRIDLEWSEDAAWRRNNGMPYLSWSDFDAVRHKGVFSRPWFTYFVIFLCVIMLIVEFGLNDWKIEPLSVNPLIGPSAEAMIDAGARYTPLIVEDGQWFRIFSPLFLHAGLVHFFVNMAALWFIGGAIEQSHGIVNAMILFFVPGIGGNILSAIFLPQYISVGASGGIFGLVGGCIADIGLNWNLLFIKDGDGDTAPKRRNIVAIAWLGTDIIVNMIIGFTPYVDNFSHLGGLVYGICCGLSTIQPLPVGFFGVQSNNFKKARAFLVRFLGLIISIILIAVTTGLLATMDLGQVFCSNCRYVSCVPFPFGAENKWWYCDDCDFATGNPSKTSDGKQYDLVELNCPDGEIEEIPVLENVTDAGLAAIQKQLPSYCRQFCEDVYAA